jgi:hypothetical protein
VTGAHKGPPPDNICGFETFIPPGPQ